MVHVVLHTKVYKMNKKYLLKIPIKTLVVENDKEKIDKSKVANVVINTMLTPMYTTESELLSLFVDEDEYDKYYLKAREIAFTSSIRAEEYLKGRLRSGTIPEETLLLLRRELSQCFGVNGLANFFFKGFGESVSRSKTLGEFSVSTTVKNNTYALRDIIDSSKDCIKDAKKSVDELKHLAASMGASFNKGACNIGNRFSYRLWFHNNLPERSTQIYASEKYGHYNGNIYKDGIRGDIYVSKSGTYYPQRAT